MNLATNHKKKSKTSPKTKSAKPLGKMRRKSAARSRVREDSAGYVVDDSRRNAPTPVGFLDDEDVLNARLRGELLNQPNRYRLIDAFAGAGGNYSVDSWNEFDMNMN